MTDWIYQSPMRRWRELAPEEPAPVFFPYWPFGIEIPTPPPRREYERRVWTKAGGYEWVRVEEDEYFRGV